MAIVHSFVFRPVLNSSLPRDSEALCSTCQLSKVTVKKNSIPFGKVAVLESYQVLTYGLFSDMKLQLVCSLTVKLL